MNQKWKGEERGRGNARGADNSAEMIPKRPDRSVGMSDADIKHNSHTVRRPMASASPALTLSTFSTIHHLLFNDVGENPE